MTWSDSITYMAIVDGGSDEISQLWAVIIELSEQLNQNRSASVSLYAQAGGVKGQALHSQTGFVLRRFNADQPQDIYDMQLERMNAAMAAENQSLQHDNKQLNTLIKEYEQTLDTLMSTFRKRAQTVQENELALIRQYESTLLQLEEEQSYKELEASTRISESIARMSEVLRGCLRELGGERTHRHDSMDEEDVEDPDLLEREPWQGTDAAHAEWALEREIELARLERENEELRALVMAAQIGPRPVPNQPQEAARIQSREGEQKDVEMDGSTSQVQSQAKAEPELSPEDNLTDVDPYATFKRTRSGG